MILTTITDIVRVVTSAAGTISIQADWADQTTTTFTPGRTNTAITTATTTTIVGSPAASTQRQVKSMTIVNTDALVANTITVQFFDGTNAFVVFAYTLAPNKQIQFNGTTWSVFSVGGGAGGIVSVVWWTGIDVNITDPDNPVANLDTATIASLGLADTAIQNISGKQDILSEGAFVNGDKTKLNGIETGATADQDLSSYALTASLWAVATSNDYYDLSNRPDLSVYDGVDRIVSATNYVTSTTIDSDSVDQYNVTAQAGALLFNNPSGTPTEGQSLIIRILDNGTARALTWGANFRAMGNALPSTTVLSKTMYLGFKYNTQGAITKWDLIALTIEL